MSALRARYCLRCGTRLVSRDDNGSPRPTCPACGFVYYRNPAPAAGVILVRRRELLLVRRRYEPRAGAWCLPAGFLEYGESPSRCALRELREETGFGSDSIEAFYDLDLVNQFHEPSYDAVVTAAVFAVRVGPTAEPHLSHEHDTARWLPIDVAHDEVIWPGYRTAIERIRDDLGEPERAAWFELTLEGSRAPH